MSDDTLFDISIYTVVPRQPIADYEVDVDYDPYWTQFERTLGDKELDETRRSLDDTGCDGTTEDKGATDVFLGESLSPTQDPNSPRNSSTSNKLELSSDINENPPRKQPIDEGFRRVSDAETNTRRKQGRRYGDGSGYIYIRTVTKKGREYHEAYYHYEFWKNGNCACKSSKYIPKRLLKQIEQMEAEKVPVTDILDLLGVIY